MQRFAEEPPHEKAAAATDATCFAVVAAVSNIGNGLPEAAAAAPAAAATQLDTTASSADVLPPPPLCKPTRFHGVFSPETAATGVLHVEHKRQGCRPSDATFHKQQQHRQLYKHRQQQRHRQ